MNVQIETNDPVVLALLQPLIETSQNYKGHFNKTYSTKDSGWTNADNFHKRTLLASLLQLPESKQFVIGTGGGHIWVSNATMCDVETSELKAADIHDRVLLIIDKA